MSRLDDIVWAISSVLWLLLQITGLVIVAVIAYAVTTNMLTSGRLICQ